MDHIISLGGVPEVLQEQLDILELFMPAVRAGALYLPVYRKQQLMDLNKITKLLRHLNTRPTTHY
jgi:surfactin synthase thioesterase subunit